MFNENSLVADAQKIMLQILCATDKICTEHHLTYWLEGGTLLGAVRHHGFIPWDDDMDISMPRKDYEQFLKIALNFFPRICFCKHSNRIRSTNSLSPRFENAAPFSLKPGKQETKTIVMEYLLISFPMTTITINGL